MGGLWSGHWGGEGGRLDVTGSLEEIYGCGEDLRSRDLWMYKGFVGSRKYCIDMCSRIQPFEAYD